METGDFDMLYLTMPVAHDIDFGIFTSANVLINPFRWQNPEAAGLAAAVDHPEDQNSLDAFTRWLSIYEGEFLRLHIDRPSRLVFFNPRIEGLNPYGFGPFTWNIFQWNLAGV